MRLSGGLKGSGGALEGMASSSGAGRLRLPSPATPSLPAGFVTVVVCRGWAGSSCSSLSACSLPSAVSFAAADAAELIAVAAGALTAVFAVTAMLCLPLPPASRAFCTGGSAGMALLDETRGLVGKVTAGGAGGREGSMAAGAVGGLAGSIAAGAVGGPIGRATAVDAVTGAGRVLVAEESVDRMRSAALGWLELVVSSLFSNVAFDAGAVAPSLLPLLALVPTRPSPALAGVGCGDAAVYEEPLTVRDFVPDLGMVILRPVDGAVVFAGVGDAVGWMPMAASVGVAAAADVFAMVGVADTLPPCGAGLPCALPFPLIDLASCFFRSSASSIFARASTKRLR